MVFRRGRYAYGGVVKPSRARPTRRYLPGSPFNVPVVESPVETFAVGDLVTHDKYGLGTVIGVEDETAILVDFGTHRLRLPLPCAKLIKLLRTQRTATQGDPGGSVPIVRTKT